MGLVHTSAVADAADRVRLDSHLGSDLSGFGMSAYFRFRDDIFVAVTDRRTFREFYFDYKRRSGYFEIVIEEYSSTEVSMLQTTTYVSEGRIRARPKLKVTPTAPFEFGFVPPSARACMVAAGMCTKFVLHFFRRSGGHARQQFDRREIPEALLPT